MGFVRAVENELAANVFQLGTEQYRIRVGRPSFVTFDRENPRNGRHKHTVYEICICLSGNGIFSSGEEEHPLVPGLVFLGCPLVPHEILFHGGEPLELLYFVMDIVKEKGGPLGDKDVVIENFLAGSRVVSQPENSLAPYALLFDGGEARGRAVTACLMEALVLDCLTALSEKAPAVSDRDKVLAYLNTNSHRQVSVPELAAALSMSERALYYFFHENFDASPREYINKKKMAIAIEYLHMGVSVGHVSDLLNFSDCSSFCRMFKKVYGISPAKLGRGAPAGTTRGGSVPSP